MPMENHSLKYLAIPIRYIHMNSSCHKTENETHTLTGIAFQGHHVQNQCQLDSIRSKRRLRDMHNRVFAMKNVYLLTHLNAEGHICRPFFIVCQIILAFCCPFILDSKVVIQQRYVQMTCGGLITITIWRITMNMNIDNPLISLQQPDFSWRPILPTH